MEIKDLGLRILYSGFVKDAINGIISYDYIEDDSNVYGREYFVDKYSFKRFFEV